MALLPRRRSRLPRPVPPPHAVAPPPPHTQANALIALLAADYPTSPSFIESACWADDLKSSGAEQEASFHFIDLPVVRDGVTPADVPDVNAVWAIEGAHSTVYAKKAAALDKARQLRFLIHIVGDVHQPLHAASLFSTEFPDGDRGGNSYMIAGVDFTNELHALWDSGAGQWVDDIVRPLNATGTAWLSDLSAKVMTAWPVSALEPEIKQYNVSTWANESNLLADSFAYTAPQAPTPIPATYLADAQGMCIKQLAIAGYRLADTIEYIFTSGAAWPLHAVRPNEEASASVASGQAVRLRLPAGALGLKASRAIK